MSAAVSVLVIAHNEESLIGKCLDSILNQSLTPDEIVVVAHNCTDKTEEIVSKYNQVKLISYQGPAGPIYARIKGFESVTGDLVVCIDGDAYAEKNWIQKMMAPLQNPKVSGVGGVVVFANIFARRISTFNNFHLIWFIGLFYKPARSWAFWGPSFALRRKDYFAIGGLEPLIELSKRLNLTECPDDFYLAVKLSQIGEIVTELGTTVRAFSKEGNSWNAIKRSQSQKRDGRKLWKYLDT